MASEASLIFSATYSNIKPQLPSTHKTANVVRTTATCCAIRKAQYTAEHAVLLMVGLHPLYQLHNSSDKIQDGVVIAQRTVAVVALLAAPRAQRSSSPRYRLRQVLELHLLLLVLLLAAMADVVLSSPTHCVIPMVHTVVVARKQDTIVRFY
jgi:hypothetical protein